MLDYHSPHGKKAKVNGKHPGQVINEILDLNFLWVEEPQSSALPFFFFPLILWFLEATIHAAFGNPT